MNLKTALETWVKLSGVDPSKYESGFSGSYRAYDILQIHRSLEEALKLDPTEITAKFLLDSHVKEYLNGKKFTVTDMLKNPDNVYEYLNTAALLTNYLQSPEIEGEFVEFENNLKSALSHYGAVSDRIEEFMKDRAFVGVLRRDAFRTINNLTVHQFLDGVPEETGYVPKYGKFLYRWTNVNSMLQAMVNMPSGVSINMIDSPTNRYAVYFTFVIRNGGRIFMFTDKESVPHPLYESMIRRPDRVLEERAERNWFPYDLTGMSYDEEGNIFFKRPEGKTIVTYQEKLQPIKALIDLHPSQLIWISMVLDMIVKKFWNSDHIEKQLSYTGEMIKVNTPLLEAAKQAGLPMILDSNPVLEMKDISLDDLHTSNVSSDQVGQMEHSRINGYLEERYKDRVDIEVLNKVSESGSSEIILIQDDPKYKLTISSLDATSFGTEKELAADRMFLARTGYAHQIQKLAQKEFDERKDEVIRWFSEQIHKSENRYMITSLCCTDVPWVKTSRIEYGFGSSCLGGISYNPAQCTRKLGSLVDLNGDYAWTRTPKHSGLLFNSGSSWAQRCYFNDTAASYCFVIQPETAAQLAWLCGLSISELPDVLQNWTQIGVYTGNSILDRIDPLVDVNDPWHSERFEIGVMLSKRALKKLDKDNLAQMALKDFPA